MARIRIFGKLGRQNVSRFIGRALFNGCGIVGFDWGNRFSWSFCRRALGRAVLNDDAGAVGRWVAGSVLIECARAGRPSMAMKLRRELSLPVFVAVARQLRISAQIIFFQRKVGVRSGKGARACG